MQQLIVVAAVGGAVVAPVTALFVVTAYAAAIGFEFACLARRHGTERRPPAARLLRAWAIEVVHGPLVFGWRQPFRRRAEADHLPPAAIGARGVVLVHGFFCNRGIWNRWLRRMRSLDIPFVAVDLEPAFGPIDAYAETIDDAVRRLHDATGLAPIVVAHSMGGVAVRAWLAERGAADRVERIYTLGSPHRGTWLARFGRSANGRQMRLSSDWLDALATRETPATRRRFVCYWSDCDNIVFPSLNATLPDADNRPLHGYAHVHMVDHPEVFDAVVRAAARPAQMS